MPSLITRLFGRAAPARPPEAKTSRVGPLLALHQVGRPVWTPRNLADLAREGYQRNPVVHRAVRMVAEAAASVPLYATDGEAERPDHPVLALLSRPNPRDGAAAFLETLYGHLVLAGNAYAEAVTLEGMPRELYALRPDRMRVVPGADGWPLAWDYTVGASTVRFPRREAGCSRSCISRCSTRWTTITACRPSRRRPMRWTCTTPPVPGTRRCSTIPPGPRARWSMRAGRGSRWRKSSSSG